MDPATLSASTLSLGQTVVAYQFFMPRLSEVRRAEPGDMNMRMDVLIGQVAAGALTVAVGVMLGMLTASRVPVFVALAVALVIAAVYQYALNTRGEASV
jgi:choline-glycine betaine transporter